MFIFMGIFTIGNNVVVPLCKRLPIYGGMGLHSKHFHLTRIYGDVFLHQLFTGMLYVFHSFLNKSVVRHILPSPPIFMANEDRNVLIICMSQLRYLQALQTRHG